MAGLIDSTLRVLGQEPLAGQISVARVLDLCGELDSVGLHALEVTGGGCFHAAVTRGVESPWERIRAFRSRATRTPLGMVLRGSFLVGDRPAPDDLVRRFISCAAESGISIFRLHDPLNDVEDLRVPAEAVRAVGGRLYAGLVYSDPPGGDDILVERARQIAQLGADRVFLHDQSGMLAPGHVGPLVQRLQEASGLPVGIYCQGPGGTALAVALEAASAGADLIGVAAYRVAVPVHRPAAELVLSAMSSLGLESSADVDAIWQVSRSIDDALGPDALPPVAPHGSLLAALNRVNAGLVSLAERRLEALGAPDRRDEVLAELNRVREEVGSPPTGAPVGQILLQQATDHILSGRRWTSMREDLRQLVLGEWGRPPGPIDPAVEAAARAQEPHDDGMRIPGLDEVRAQSDLASAEEELLLVALFGDRSRRLLEHLRGRHSPSDVDAAGPAELERVRRIVDLVEERDVSEITIEEDGVRITVRRQVEPQYVIAHGAAAPPARGRRGRLVGVARCDHRQPDGRIVLSSRGA